MRNIFIKAIVVLIATVLIQSCGKKKETSIEEIPLNSKIENADLDQLASLKLFAKRYARAWGSQVPDSVASFFSGDGSLRVNDGDKAVGADEIALVAESFMTDLPDMLVRYDSLVNDSNGVEFHWTLIATNSGPGGTGNKVNVSGYEVWTIGEDGLIKESQGHFPTEEYNRQLQSGIKHHSDEDFKEIDFADLNAELQKASDTLGPKEIMRKFYPAQVESGEGNERIDIRETKLSDGTTEIELIHDNLMDDSVKAKKFLMILKGEKGKWQIVSLKHNWRCWSGRGNETWSTELCT